MSVLRQRGAGPEPHALGPAGTFVQVRTVSELNVDTSRGETIQINVRGAGRAAAPAPPAPGSPLRRTWRCSHPRRQLDITLPHMPCSVLSLDVMDVSGEEQLDVSHTVLKARAPAAVHSRR